MKIDDLRKELQQENEELQRLEANRTDIAAEIEQLLTNRGAAIRALASGDEKQQGVIAEIDQKTAGLQLRADGFLALINDLKEDISVLTQQILKAQEEEDAAFNAYLYQREAEECGKIQQTVPERVSKITGLYFSLCRELGELQVDSYRDDSASRALELIRSSINDIVDKAGVRQLTGQGYNGAPIMVHHFVETPWDPTATGFVNPIEVNQERAKERRAGFAEQFRRERRA